MNLNALNKGKTSSSTEMRMEIAKTRTVFPILPLSHLEAIMLSIALQLIKAIVLGKGSEFSNLFALINPHSNLKPFSDKYYIFLFFFTAFKFIFL